MCIVVISKKGNKFPSVETIQNCCENNPDGFSMAWNEDDKVLNFKSMSQKRFMGFYKKFIKSHDFKETSLILHARIATHGSVGIKNCHCWIKNGIAFAHNGILSIKNRGDMTDSQTFFEDIFLPVLKAGGMESATKVVDACIGNSKFAFLDKDGNIAEFGIFNEDADGNKYSNYSYEKRKCVRIPTFDNSYYEKWLREQHNYNDDLDDCVQYY